MPARKKLKKTAKTKTSKAKTGTAGPPRSLGAAPGKTKKGKPAAGFSIRKGCFVDFVDLFTHIKRQIRDGVAYLSA